MPKICPHVRLDFRVKNFFLLYCLVDNHVKEGPFWRGKEIFFGVVCVGYGQKIFFGVVCVG